MYNSMLKLHDVQYWSLLIPQKQEHKGKTVSLLHAVAPNCMIGYPWHKSTLQEIKKLRSRFSVQEKLNLGTM